MTAIKFFTFRQNNSFGRWEGPARFVNIAAPSARVANAMAEDHGVYFDGCDDGRDCPCCGDRWYRVDESDAADTNEVTLYAFVGDKFVSRTATAADKVEGTDLPEVVWF